MFEFHGWFNLSDSPCENDVGRLASFVGRLEQQVAALDWHASLAFAEVRVLNGEYRLVVGGSLNHRGQIGRELDELLEFVATEAPGSYGLLHWRDMEGELPAGPNNYHVVVMARGTLTLRLDPFLSPTIPTVEDPWEPGAE